MVILLLMCINISNVWNNVMTMDNDYYIVVILNINNIININIINSIKYNDNDNM